MDHERAAPAGRPASPAIVWCCEAVRRRSAACSRAGGNRMVTAPRAGFPRWVMVGLGLVLGAGGLRTEAVAASMVGTAECVQQKLDCRLQQWTASSVDGQCASTSVIVQLDEGARTQRGLSLAHRAGCL